MGRRERPLVDGPLRDFAMGLRALRVAAGNPTYRALSQRARYSTSALSAAANGQTLPTLEVTLAYVRACAGDDTEWRARWQKLSIELHSPDTLPSAVAKRDTRATPPCDPRRPGTAIVLGLIVLVTTLSVGALRAHAMP